MAIESDSAQVYSVTISHWLCIWMDLNSMNWIRLEFGKAIWRFSFVHWNSLLVICGWAGVYSFGGSIFTPLKYSRMNSCNMTHYRLSRANWLIHITLMKWRRIRLMQMDRRIVWRNIRLTEWNNNSIWKRNNVQWSYGQQGKDRRKREDMVLICLEYNAFLRILFVQLFK